MQSPKGKTEIVDAQKDAWGKFQKKISETCIKANSSHKLMLRQKTM